MTLMRDYIDLEVQQERSRQNEKWGEQNLPSGTTMKYFAPLRTAKRKCDEAAKENRITWLDILKEEVYEVFAETDETKLREELIQVIAVSRSWVECLDRKKKNGSRI